MTVPVRTDPVRTDLVIGTSTVVRQPRVGNDEPCRNWIAALRSQNRSRDVWSR